jgi:hypothetical protein
MKLRLITTTRALFTAFAISAAFACFPGASRSTAAQGLTEYQRQERAESLSLVHERDTTYKRRMLDLIRRTRLVRTDSLARLYAALTRTPQSEWWRLRLAIGCESARLAHTYGLIPSLRADQHARDSLQSAGIDIERIGDTYLGTPGPAMSISPSECGMAMFQLPRIPDSLSGLPHRFP